MVKHDLQQNLPPSPAPTSLSDAGLANVLDSITDGFCVLDAHWNIRYINTRGAEMLAPGHAPGTALAGTRLWQACPDLQGTELETHFRRAMALRQSGSVELFHAPLERWLEVRLFAAADGLTIQLHDISQRRATEDSLRQSEEDLRALADSIPQLAWTANFDGTMAWYNQRWHDYTGTTPGEMEGEGWGQGVRPALPAANAGGLESRVAQRHAVRNGIPHPRQRRSVPLVSHAGQSGAPRRAAAALVRHQHRCR